MMAGFHTASQMQDRVAGVLSGVWTVLVGNYYR
jgi:hypothetical protein